MSLFGKQKTQRWLRQILSQMLSWHLVLATVAQGGPSAAPQSSALLYGKPAIVTNVAVEKRDRLMEVKLEITQSVTVTTALSTRPRRLVLTLERTKTDWLQPVQVHKAGLETVRLAPAGYDLQVLFELSKPFHYGIELSAQQIIVYVGEQTDVQIRDMEFLTARLNNSQPLVTSKPPPPPLNFKPGTPNYSAGAQSVAKAMPTPSASPVRQPTPVVTPKLPAPAEVTLSIAKAPPTPSLVAVRQPAPVATPMPPVRVAAPLNVTKATPTPTTYLAAVRQTAPVVTPTSPIHNNATPNAARASAVVTVAPVRATATPLPTPNVVKPTPTPAAVLAQPTAAPAQVSARSGRKNFSEGMKYENRQQWELAAQHFAVADVAEPNNPEYKLHLLRAQQNASVALARQGDDHAARQEYAEAYRAYHLAGYYDAVNQQAHSKKERMRQLLEAPAGSHAELKTTSAPRRNELRQQIMLRDVSLRQTIENFAETIGLNVLFDDSFKDDPKFRIKLQDVTMPKVLDMIFMQTKHVFEQIDRRTIFVYQDTGQQRQRFEQLQIRTFYLANADLNEMKGLVQSLVGQNRQVLPAKHLNALVVRDTESNLRLVEELLKSIDKNRPSVVIDVNIYEVSRTASLELGNQLATQSKGEGLALNNLGGIGRAGVVALAGNALTGSLGTIIGLPPSSLSLLQSKGHSRLLANTQIHALDGESNQTKVGRSVPVRIGTTYVPGLGGLNNGNGSSNNNSILGGAAIENVQYRDVGLTIDVTPTIINDNIQIKMRLESTNVEASGEDTSLTPSFTQRSLTTIARVQNGQTAIVAGVKQEAKGESRVGLPFVGMLPLLGRVFSTPRQSSNLSDIVITVTPNIMRAAEFNPDDHLARRGGTFAGGVTPTIEALYDRAETEDEKEEVERRLIAQNSPATSAPPSPQAVTLVAQTMKPVAFQSQAAPVVELSLLPNLIEQEVGESFYVAVSLYGQVKLNDAQVALRFDPALLSLKSVRSGGLLGAQAHINHKLTDGRLHIKIQQAEDRDAPINANGQLLLLEFTTLNAGQTQLDVDLSETELRQGGGLNVQLQKQQAQVRITRSGQSGQ